MKLDDVKIEFAPNVKNNAKADCIKLLKAVAVKSNEPRIVISSAARTPADQARVMFDNCKKDLNYQYEIYGRNGDKVIKAYEKGVKDGLSRFSIIESMRKKIIEIGPSLVSKHCTDIAIYNVFDIPATSVKNHSEFKKALENFVPNPIYKVIVEPKNNCFHVEMKIADVSHYFRNLEFEKTCKAIGVDWA